MDVEAENDTHSTGPLLPVPGIVAATSKNHDQIIAMDDFLVRNCADGLADLFGAQAADFASVGGGIIRQAAGKLRALGIAKGDHVPLEKRADHLHHTDRQE